MMAAGSSVAIAPAATALPAASRARDRMMMGPGCPLAAQCASFIMASTQCYRRAGRPGREGVAASIGINKGVAASCVCDY